jgi:quinol monooxygenase YgiN
MNPQIAFALYRPRRGKDAALRKLIARHVPTLRRLELITDRVPIRARAGNGTYLEIFEWRSEAMVNKAHQHPEVAAIWEAMEEIADMPALDSLPEAKGTFPHFEPVNI